MEIRDFLAEPANKDNRKSISRVNEDHREEVRSARCAAARCDRAPRRAVPASSAVK
jgi:hypothetical protein